MNNITAPLQFLQAFRQKLLGIFPRRADALFELIDALLLTLDPRSPVELSLSPAFRRRFSMVYDALRHGQVDPELARQLLASAEPEDALEVVGYGVYALDSTVHPREDAETLADRGKVYSASKEGTVPGHQYSWLGRVIAQGQSWFAPRDVERIATSTTPAGVAAKQVKRLALTLASNMQAVIVADSHYAKKVLLVAFVNLPNLFILVRLACNRVLYGPPPVVTGSRRRGRPRAHGDKFRLKSPPPPQHQAMWWFGKATVRLSAWSQLHFKDVPMLVGMVVRVEFLTATGQAMYQRPLWLFWNGPSTVPLEALCLMYLLRFGIEHFFRFAKQRLGLMIAQTPDLAASMTWVWIVALAYTQLLLARTVVTAQPRPWDPKFRRDPQRPLTPGQVRQAWPAFSHGLGTPAQAPRPSGKSPGRSAGFQPTPRPRFPVVSKKQKQASVAPA
jgi:hypothetical protein